MKIRRIILKGVRNFTDFDHCFEDTWNGEVPDSLLLIGPNGSGKTTLLNIIAELWQMIANKILVGETRKSIDTLILNDDVLKTGGFAAMEIIELDSKPVWIYAGSYFALKSFLPKTMESHLFSATLGVDDKGGQVFYWYSSPGTNEFINVSRNEMSFSQPDWFFTFSKRLEENTLRKRTDMPNMVYLESETRNLKKIKGKFEVTREDNQFQWLAKYVPTDSRKGSLQNYLYNLKVVDTDAYNRIIKSLNIFLVGKEIIDFSPKGELRVLVNSSYKHPIEDLSAGEKQVLLMLVTIHRWMQPGGIVLIDEPDLHLHVSLMNAFASHLRRMVAEKGGQLILASHAPELWQLFKESEIVRLGKFGMEENL